MGDEGEGMPRWRALPDGLEPEIAEFVERLRRIVARSGMAPEVVADCTGFDETSWEAYLEGRLLPPLRAVVGLAEATGVDAGHLTTLWEQAERAWNRAEMPLDATMEELRVAQARAALEGRREPAAPLVEPRPVAVDRAGAGGRRRAVVGAVVAGVVAVAVCGVLWWQPARSGAQVREAAVQPSGAARAEPEASATGCSGGGCMGRDPDEMGCGGERAVTSARGMAGAALIEVRYSQVCRAAWARIAGAAPGGQVTVAAGGHRALATVGRSREAYTPMVAAGKPSEVTVCATTAGGATGCTRSVAGNRRSAP